MLDTPPAIERRFIRRTTVLLILAAALLIAGCSGEMTVTSDELAKQVEDSYVDQTGIEIESISCEEVTAEVGNAITCKATNASEVDLTIEGKITAVNEDDEKVDFDWEVASAEVPGAHYAEGAKRALEEQTGNRLSSIECPDRVKLQPNSDFRCTLTTPDGSELGATVTMTDGEGGFDVKVDE